MLTETLVTALPAGIAARSGAGELGKAGSDAGGMGAQAADGLRYHKTNKHDPVVHSEHVPLSALQLRLSQVREHRKRGLAVSYHLESVLLAYGSGKSRI